MGLFKFLKDKFKKKEENSLENEQTLESVKKYDEGLAKSRENFSKRLKALNKEFKSKKLDDNYFNNLEEILIEADCGVEFTLNTIEKLVEIVKKEKLTDLKEINERLISLMFNNYNDDNQNEDDITLKEGLNVFLVVGVNGVGKTTSIAKLANFYLKQNKKVLLVAGDTFRAGAKEQLTIWANRLNINIITGKENEDPASVSYAGDK